MSLHFSANQYDKKFDPKILQNWEVPSEYRQRPRAFLGFTQIVASNRGHLLAGVKRSRESPWGTFVGTYDMPLKIPGNHYTNECARTENALMRLDRMKTDGDLVIKGKLKQCKIPSPLPVKADCDADKTLPAGGLISSANGARSGARNPEPKSTVAVASSPPKVPSPTKVATPQKNLDWPRPGSQGSRAGSRAKSASPCLTSPLPPISPPRAGPMGTPPVVSPVRTPADWPSPKPVADPQCA